MTPAWRPGGADAGVAGGRHRRLRRTRRRQETEREDCRLHGANLPRPRIRKFPALARVTSLHEHRDPRALDRKRDRKGVEAIDTAFETATIFDVTATPRALALVEHALPAPITKRYSIGEVFAQWARWERGWVATDPDAADADTIRGFATVEHEAWHARLTLWFLYIAPAYRRRGVGRALLAEVEAYGRGVGATHVWLESSNVNVPGVAAYERLGYALCGADQATTTARTCRARPRSISRSHSRRAAS